MYEKRLKRFLQETSVKNQSTSPKALGEDPPKKVSRPRNQLIKLPSIDAINLPQTPLDLIIKARHTVRLYDPVPMPLETLSYLLYATQGNRDQKKHIVFKTVPSAGATQPFEVCLLINRVVGIKPGLYQYLDHTHQLNFISDDASLINDIQHASLHDVMTAKAAVLYILIAHHEITAYRYSERAIRYVFMDSGHVMQNLYLTATQFDLGMCAIGHYDDELINQALALNDKAFVIYMATLGKPHA